MNERILELAEQADEYTDNKIQMPGEYHPDWHDIRDQKFAELIVKECNTYLWSYEVEWTHHKENQILQFFGVKE
jgi:predicted nucleic-acid-binding Zn-ribbon protein